MPPARRKPAMPVKTPTPTQTARKAPDSAAVKKPSEPAPDRGAEENPWHQAMAQLDRAASKMSLEPFILERLRHPKRTLTVSVPVRMDSGAVRIFEGQSLHPQVVQLAVRRAFRSIAGKPHRLLGRDDSLGDARFPRGRIDWCIDRRGRACQRQRRLTEKPAARDLFHHLWCCLSIVDCWAEPIGSADPRLMALLPNHRPSAMKGMRAGRPLVAK